MIVSSFTLCSVNIVCRIVHSVPHREVYFMGRLSLINDAIQNLMRLNDKVVAKLGRNQPKSF